LNIPEIDDYDFFGRGVEHAAPLMAGWLCKSPRKIDPLAEEGAFEPCSFNHEDRTMRPQVSSTHRAGGATPRSTVPVRH
jgi:hypothetical protein